MIARGEGGAIVNIGSMWAHQAIGVTPSSGHSMQKAGLHALTHNLAIELAGHKIRVNAVAPAAVKTPALERWVPKDEIDATLDTFAPFHPLGRVGTPADVANAVRICSLMRPAGSPARFSTSTAASWPAATNPMEVVGL